MALNEYIFHYCLKYLKGTLDLGLWYPCSSELILEAYTYVDWEWSINDRKITSGATFFLGKCLVSWLRKKQSSVSMSISKSKYIDATCCAQVLWMMQTLKDVQVEYDQPISVLCDLRNRKRWAQIQGELAKKIVHFPSMSKGKRKRKINLNDMGSNDKVER